MANEPLLQLDLPGIRKLKSGKVREIFDLGDRLLFVATDRISAFDCIMPNGIPRKGEVLTQISYFWFAQTEAFQPNHLLSRPGDPLPARLQPYAAQLARRSMIVKKAQPLAIECVVRGYLAGSGWKEYREQQTVCGIKLPPGPEGILGIARAHLHPGHQGRVRPRREHLLRAGRADCRRRASPSRRARPASSCTASPATTPAGAASSSPTRSSSSASSTANSS